MNDIKMLTATIIDYENEHKDAEARGIKNGDQ